MSIIKTIVCASSFSFFSSLALLPLSSQVHAISELEQGFQAQSKSDLTSAANYFLTAAQAGSSEAQYQLGLLYVQGIGIDSNLVKAKILIQKAADQGHLLATKWLSLQTISAATGGEDEDEDPEDDC